MIFETKRLRVRKLKISDLNDFHKMQSDIDVMRYITGKSATFNESIAKLNEWIARYETKTMEWPYAVELMDSGSFVGICGIIDANEVGYRFQKQYWKNGFGTEILNGLILFSKEKGLNNLIAQVAIQNKGSLKILTSAGFRITKETVCKKTLIPEYIMKLGI